MAVGLVVEVAAAAAVVAVVVVDGASRDDGGDDDDAAFRASVSDEIDVLAVAAVILGVEVLEHPQLPQLLPRR